MLLNVEAGDILVRHVKYDDYPETFQYYLVLAVEIGEIVRIRVWDLEQSRLGVFAWDTVNFANKILSGIPDAPVTLTVLRVT